jgi:hypothetical protein
MGICTIIDSSMAILSSMKIWLTTNMVKLMSKKLCKKIDIYKNKDVWWGVQVLFPSFVLLCLLFLIVSFQKKKKKKKKKKEFRLNVFIKPNILQFRR